MPWSHESIDRFIWQKKRIDNCLFRAIRHFHTRLEWQGKYERMFDAWSRKVVSSDTLELGIDNIRWHTCKWTASSAHIILSLSLSPSYNLCKPIKNMDMCSLLLYFLRGGWKFWNSVSLKNARTYTPEKLTLHKRGEDDWQCLLRLVCNINVEQLSLDCFMWKSTSRIISQEIVLHLKELTCFFKLPRIISWIVIRDKRVSLWRKVEFIYEGYTTEWWIRCDF